MPMPTLQPPHAFSAAPISPASASSAAAYSRVGYSRRRRRCSLPSASSTTTAILVPPMSTPTRIKGSGPFSRKRFLTPFLRLDPLAEPRTRCRRIFQAPARGALALAHLDGVPTHRVHHAKAVFVGDVVAEEYRHAAAERRLAHEFGDRLALVAAGGLELDHHLAALHFDLVAERLGGFADLRVRGGGELRREAVVERDARALVLEHETLVPRGEAADADRHRPQHVRGKAMPMAQALRVASLGAVLPGGGHDERREDLVDARERTAADHRDRALGRAREAPDERELAIVGVDRVGRVGDLEERAVEIQEEGPMSLEWRHSLIGFPSAAVRRARAPSRGCGGACAPRRAACARPSDRR